MALIKSKTTVEIPHPKLRFTYDFRNIITVKIDVVLYHSFQNIVSVKVDHPVMLEICHNEVKVLIRSHLHTSVRILSRHSKYHSIQYL